jgi:hypothetical protein
LWCGQLCTAQAFGFEFMRKPCPADPTSCFLNGGQLYSSMGAFGIATLGADLPINQQAIVRFGARS